MFYLWADANTRDALSSYRIKHLNLHKMELNYKNNQLIYNQVLTIVWWKGRNIYLYIVYIPPWYKTRIKLNSNNMLPLFNNRICAVAPDDSGWQLGTLAKTSHCWVSGLNTLFFGQSCDENGHIKWKRACI